jgi:hypothetical protein
MGVSTDALVMYGVALLEGWESADDEGNEIDKESLAEDDPRRLVDEVEDDLGGGLALEIHCSYDCPMYVLGIEATRKRAWRGYPQTLTELGPQDGEAILEYCKKWKLPIDESVNDGKPGWLLFSMWG